jgi:hypothetical protein
LQRNLELVQFTPLLRHLDPFIGDDAPRGDNAGVPSFNELSLIGMASLSICRN